MLHVILAANRRKHTVLFTNQLDPKRCASIVSAKENETELPTNTQTQCVCVCEKLSSVQLSIAFNVPVACRQTTLFDLTSVSPFFFPQTKLLNP